MTKRVVTVLVTGAIVASSFAAATSASATPSRKRCSACHQPSSDVHITLQRKSSTKTTATYTIRVTGGSGRAGWAVFSGSRNIAHKTSATGTFKVKKGKSYTVRAVKRSSGSAAKRLSVK